MQMTGFFLPTLGQSGRSQVCMDLVDRIQELLEKNSYRAVILFLSA